jgi:hypothetical protein
MSRSYKGTKVVFFSDDLDILCSFRIKIWNEKRITSTMDQ